ncbi:hypothetical protein Pint_33602 [Pistacia integerrima]|uniref:Uncharacterized protein n=1 Tax=Pistacia integerrima TaxID=434235 RepID=A0ACC0X6E1_9ROSI|nr:hypothetical protein Pint_33602 [Pistacia integerrima]
MIKRLPSRNQRSKGVRVKHVLQICLLLGVCFWLIYQVKHSHDKKREFDEKDSKASVKAQSDNEILKLGRKDLPKLQEVDKNEKHEEEEEDAVEEEENKPEEEQKEIRMHVEEDQEEAKHEEEEQEDEENKHEEEEQDEETKTEEERRGGEDEETDEQDQERTESEGDREDEFLDEEKEREGDGDDKENEGEEIEEKDNQVENENSSDDHDNDGDTNAHVAREEHYKADDASSAVSHDNQITITETDKGSLENSNEKERNILENGSKTNNIEESNGIQNSTELKSGEGEMAESGSLLNVITTEEKDHGTRSNNPDISLHSNARTNLTETGTETSNNSTGLSTQISAYSLKSETETTVVSNQAQNAAVDGATNLEAINFQITVLQQVNNSNTISDGNQSNSNSSVSTETINADAALGDSFNNSNLALSEKIMSSNATVVGKVSSGSLATKETTDAAQNETLNSGGESGGTNETSQSSSTDSTGDAHSDSETNISTNGTGDAHGMSGTVDVAKEDHIDSSDFSIIHDEKESLIDLETLSDIRTNVDHNEDAASE